MDKIDTMRTKSKPYQFNGNIILNGLSNIRAVNFNGKVYVEREDLMHYLDSLKDTFGFSNKGVNDILTVVKCYVSLMDKEKRWDDEDQNK